ncbi:hypothetical protein PAMP_018811 [Pampus punctatissimus]
MIQNGTLTAVLTLLLGEDRDTESAVRDASKTDVPEDFDIDMENPETEKAAVAIQSQFRKFQKKKRDEKS